MKHKPYRKLFASTFALSAFTFGGGYVMVPLMKKKFVDTLGWLEEDEMLNLTAIAQSAPGPIAVNASILIGYRVAGILGAACTILGTILPPLLVISVIFLFYQAFRDNAVVQAVLRGMQAGVGAVIVDVVYTMVTGVWKNNDKKLLPVLIMVGVFVANVWLNVNVMLLIAVCAVLGILAGLWQRRKGGE